MTDLKPCPFCGGEAEVYVVTLWDSSDSIYGYRGEGRCYSCNVVQKTKGSDGRDQHEAARLDGIAAWNTRASEHSDRAAEVVPDAKLLDAMAIAAVVEIEGAVTVSTMKRALRAALRAYATSKGKA